MGPRHSHPSPCHHQTWSEIQALENHRADLDAQIGAQDATWARATGNIPSPFNNRDDKQQAAWLRYASQVTNRIEESLGKDDPQGNPTETIASMLKKFSKDMPVEPTPFNIATVAAVCRWNTRAVSLLIAKSADLEPGTTPRDFADRFQVGQPTQERPAWLPEYVDETWCLAHPTRPRLAA